MDRTPSNSNRQTTDGSGSFRSRAAGPSAGLAVALLVAMAIVVGLAGLRPAEPDATRSVAGDITDGWYPAIAAGLADRPAAERAGGTDADVIPHRPDIRDGWESVLVPPRPEVRDGWDHRYFGEHE